jgi:hypothetical protein
VDPVFLGLDLGAPKTLQAEVKEYDFKTQGDAFPRGEKVSFEFALHRQAGTGRTQLA